MFHMVVAFLCMTCRPLDRYVEVHMEQGPVLQSRGAAVAPVSSIAGQTRLTVTFLGSQVAGRLAQHNMFSRDTSQLLSYVI